MTRKREDNPKIAFGKSLRKIRASKGLSQEQLADLADIHRTYVGDVERGTRNISLMNMSRIARALGIPLSKMIADMEQHS